MRKGPACWPTPKDILKAIGPALTAVLELGLHKGVWKGQEDALEVIAEAKGVVPDEYHIPIAAATLMTYIHAAEDTITKLGGTLDE